MVSELKYTHARVSRNLRLNVAIIVQICHLEDILSPLHCCRFAMPSATTLVLELLVLTIPSGVSDFTILPNPNATCQIWSCYTLSQVMDNPSQYFTPKTSAVFPPGKYAISSGQLIIQNVHDLSLFGDNTVLQCKGQLGLALINITNLTISSLHFSMCGVPMNETAYVAECLGLLTPNSPASGAHH